MTESSNQDLKHKLAHLTGLDRALLERPDLATFVIRRCRELGLSDERAYHEAACRNPDEMERLIQQVSVPETWLFRYPASFELLVRHLAGLRARTSGRLRMLSAACATGEEPYCMAMAAAAAGWPLEQISVDALDRHAESLAIARRATYGPNSLRDAIPEWAEPWLHHGAGRVQVDARIVAAVNYGRTDILSDFPALDIKVYEVIFCRNLFIYLGKDARKKLVENLATALAPHGLLFVGHAEQAVILRDKFDLVAAPYAFALRLKQSSAAESVAATNDLSRSGVQPTRRQDSKRTGDGRVDSSRKHGPQRSQRPQPGKRTAVADAARRRTRTVDESADLISPAPTGGAALEPDAPTIEDARKLADSGRLEDALASVKALLLRTQPCAELYALLGSVHLGRQEFAEARDAFHRVLYLTPDHEAALLQVAIVHEQMGERELAARYRQRAARAHVDQSSLQQPEAEPESDEQAQQTR